MDNNLFHILERFAMKKTQDKGLENFKDGRFKFYCINKHLKNGELDPLELIPVESEQENYCPKYFNLSLNNPDGRNVDEAPCLNSLSFDEEKIVVEHFKKLYQESILGAESVDYTNYKFSLGYIDYKVLLHEIDKDLLHIGFINKNPNKE